MSTQADRSDESYTNDVCLVDCGVACALGCQLNEVWSSLCRGRTAVGPVRSFDTGQLDFHNAACMADLEAKTEPNRVCALMGRALAQLRPVPAGTFVIWAGVKGRVEFIEAQAAGTPLPGIHRAEHYRRWVCERLGVSGQGMEVSAACASSTVALALAAQRLAGGECESVLVCAADVVSRFTFTGFASLRGLSPTTCRPFDVGRDGLCLGDGAAATLLTTADAAKTLGYVPRARLTGWAVANDANHITGPARDGHGLTLAIRRALQRAAMPADQIESWCTHGTGTIYNDAMELTALEAVFGQRRFPIFSVKGAIGHTLGAAGALEANLCAKTLEERTVPPTAALQTPEPRAVGRVAAVAQRFPGHAILTTNSGFGGINAALVLEAPGARAPYGRA